MSTSRRELGSLVCGRPADADDCLGSGKELAARDDIGARRLILSIREARLGARALFDSDRKAGAHEPPDRVGDERYPALAGFGLFRDDDPHRDATLRKREGNRHPLWKPSGVGSLLTTFSTALEARDPSLRGHSARVTAFAEALAVALGWTGKRLETLRLGGSLHDVGKISVHVSVLRKPGPLTDEEFGQIKRHPVAGARLVECFDDFLTAVPAVLHHHERWDGTGYPHRLEGDTIPLEARVLGVADAFDAMTSVSLSPSALCRGGARRAERCAGRSSIPGSSDVRRSLGAGDNPADSPVGIAI
jgi:HD-GYP domain-containing protein (c-di-GMP phosphodiesterase class II)